LRQASIRNGLALCGTAHWMFDRGLLAVADGLSILTVKRGRPEDVERLLLPDRTLRAPTDATMQPHRRFLRWHRENVFKG
jgi:putative restriction endonuclease